MSEMMIATIFTRKNSGYLCKAAFDFCDWWAKQKKPNNLMELFKTQVEISNKMEELRTRYNLPNFFTD